MSRTLKLSLLAQAIPPQLDYLLHALDSLQPPGDDLMVIDEVLVETRRVFADLRRVLASMPLQQPDPVSPITRRDLRKALRNALTVYVLFDEEQRQRILAQRRDARRAALAEKAAANLSPRPFAFLQ